MRVCTTIVFIVTNRIYSTSNINTGKKRIFRIPLYILHSSNKYFSIPPIILLSFYYPYYPTIFTVYLQPSFQPPLNSEMLYLASGSEYSEEIASSISFIYQFVDFARIHEFLLFSICCLRSRDIHLPKR